jgi:hypothetical protein
MLSSHYDAILRNPLAGMFGVPINLWHSEFRFPLVDCSLLEGPFLFIMNLWWCPEFILVPFRTCRAVFFKGDVFHPTDLRGCGRTQQWTFWIPFPPKCGRVWESGRDASQSDSLRQSDSHN